jgi:hypothetical protein
MESLNSKPPKKSEKTKAEATERLTLQKPEQEKLERWVQELNTRFDGMIRVTKSDLANFLIRLHPDSLSDSETAQIEHEHFDEVRWINWALNKIRAAKKEGYNITLNDLMKKRQLQSQEPLKPTSRKRKSSTAEKNQATTEDQTHLPSSDESLDSPET